MNSVIKRSWVSPFVALSFIFVGITGVLMFFHIRGPLINLVHELAGMIFALGGSIHLFINWKVFASYIRRSTGITVLVLFFLVLLAIIFSPKPPPGSERGDDFRHGASGRAGHDPIMLK